MCCCDKPNVNGELGYKWNQPNAAPGTRPVHPPTIEEGDTLVRDAAGRCGRGTDSHCHHYAIVAHGPALYMLVQHGGGCERFRLGNPKYFRPVLDALSSDDFYWMMNGIYRAIEHAADIARTNEKTYWQTAAAEKRIKVRTRRERGGYRFTKVSVEPKTTEVQL